MKQKLGKQKLSPWQERIIKMKGKKWDFKFIDGEEIKNAIIEEVEIWKYQFFIRTDDGREGVIFHAIKHIIEPTLPFGKESEKIEKVAEAIK